MSVRHSPPAQSRTWYAPDASTTREGRTAASSRGRSASSASAESSQQSPSAPCRMSCGVAPPRTTSHASCARLLPTPIPRKRERREETSIPPAESFSSGRGRREDGRSQTRSPAERGERRGGRRRGWGRGGVQAERALAEPGAVPVRRRPLLLPPSAVAEERRGLSQPAPPTRHPRVWREAAALGRAGQGRGGQGRACAAGGKSGSVKGEPDSRQKERTRSSTSAARAYTASLRESTRRRRCLSPPGSLAAPHLVRSLPLEHGHGGAAARAAGGGRRRLTRRRRRQRLLAERLCDRRPQLQILLALSRGGGGRDGGGGGGACAGGGGRQVGSLERRLRRPRVARSRWWRHPAHRSGEVCVWEDGWERRSRRGLGVWRGAPPG